MPISIYNSLSRKKEPFEPINPPEIKMYCCGPTVYDEPHIGHARSAYIFDVIRKYLEYRYKDKGYTVKFVRNITDVDDKIIDKARKEYPDEDLNTAYKKVSDKYISAYHQALTSLGISSSETSPVIEPKASEYIDKMIIFISSLIEKGKAYQSGGDVYFDIMKAKDYGKLSNQALDKMEIGARISPLENKRNPLDFALWKSAKENEPFWPSPWGNGRPGWHIECSVMSLDILGDQFDIHGGGIDLIFPHHENEIAQSEGAGKKFANFWIHHGLLTIQGQKMAKSLGNFVTIEEVLNKYSADILKIFYLQALYSSPIDFSWERMEEAKKAYESINILMTKLDRIFGTRDVESVISWGTGAIGHFKEQFIEVMDDDFNTPKALSVLFEMVRKCNILLDSEDKEKNGKLNYAMGIIKEIANVFSLSFLKEVAGELSNDKIEWYIAARNVLKKAKKFSEADELRKTLYEKGIILEDTKEGTTWRRKI